MGEYKIKPMWLALTLTDNEGQYVHGFALETRSLSIHMLDGKDIVMDVVHTDGEHERIQFRAVTPGPCADLTTYFQLGTMPEFIAGIRMTGEFPNQIPISKDEYRKRCGTGKLINERGHFANV